MRYSFMILSLLLLTAAIPAYEVNIALTPDSVSIINISEYQKQLPMWPGGSWIVELQAADGSIVSQNTFDPYLILPSGEKSLLDEVSVIINAAPIADKLIVYDDKGLVVAQKKLLMTCGDGICSGSEQGYCYDDCPVLPSNTLSTEPVVESEDEGFALWRITVIITIIVLIIILLVFLKHTSKPPQKNDYY